MGVKRNRLNGNSKPGRGGASFPFPPFIFSSPARCELSPPANDADDGTFYDARSNASLPLRTLLYSSFIREPSEG